MVKLLVAEKAFEKTLSCGSKNNAESTNTNLFRKRTTVLSGRRNFCKTIFIEHNKTRYKLVYKL